MEPNVLVTPETARILVVCATRHGSTMQVADAASLTEDGSNQVEGVPVVKDPWLVKPPRTPG